MNKTGVCIQGAQRENKHAIKLIEVNEISARIDICTRVRDGRGKASI